MPKIILTALFLSLLTFTSTTLTHAQTRQLTKEESRLELQQKATERAKITNEIRSLERQRKASVEAKLSEVRKTQIKRYWQKLGKVLLAAIERLDKLVARIDSRLTKIESTNPQVSTTQMRADLTTAKNLLAATRIKYAALTESLGTVLESTDPKVAFSVIRADILEIKKDLKEVHRLLVKIISTIKGLRMPLTPTPTQ